MVGNFDYLISTSLTTTALISNNSQLRLLAQNALFSVPNAWSSAPLIVAGDSFSGSLRGNAPLDLSTTSGAEIISPAVIGFATSSNNVTSKTTCTSTLPAAAAPGDLLLAVVGANLGDPQTCVDDWGMTSLFSGPIRAGTKLSAYVFAKTLTTTDITNATVTFTWSNAGKVVASAVVLRGQALPAAFTTPGTSTGSTVAIPATSGSEQVLVLAAGRVLSGTHTTIGIPAPFGADVSNYAETGSGANTSTAIGINTGTASGTITTSPTGDAEIAFSLAMDLFQIFSATGSAPLTIASASLAIRSATGSAPTALSSTSLSAWCVRGSAPLNLPSSDGLGLGSTAPLTLSSSNAASWAAIGNAPLSLASVSSGATPANGSAPLSLISSNGVGLRGSAAVSLGSGSATTNVGLASGSGPLTLASGDYAGSVTGASPLLLASNSSSVFVRSVTGSGPLTLTSGGSSSVIARVTGTAPLSLRSDSSAAPPGSAFSDAPLIITSGGSSLLIVRGSGSASLSITSSSRYTLFGNAPLGIVTGTSSYLIASVTGSAPLDLVTGSLPCMVDLTLGNAPVELQTNGWGSLVSTFDGRGIVLLDSLIQTMSVVSSDGQQLVFDPVVIHKPVQVDPSPEVFVVKDPLLWDVSIDPALVFHVESTDEHT